MSVQRRGKGWRCRWKEGDRWRSRTFDRKADALLFDAELRRRRRLGSLASLDAGLETLDQYTADTWTPTYGAVLSAKTQALYSSLYDTHVSPTLGGTPLRELTPELIARWYSDRKAADAGPVAVRKALTLLGGILQRAHESGRIASNPARTYKPAKLPRRSEVRPLAPATVEKMRAAASPRDAALLSVMAYGGLRPGEALALRWGDVRDRTLLVTRSLSLGAEKGTKTGEHRTVRLLEPLREDLAKWRRQCGGAFPMVRLCFEVRTASRGPRPPTNPGVARPLPAHSCGRVAPRAPLRPAPQLREPAPPRGPQRDLRRPPTRPRCRLTLTRYGHVIDELDDLPRRRQRPRSGSHARPHVPVLYPTGPTEASPEAPPIPRNSLKSPDGRSRARTGDLLLVRQALYQLS